MAQKILAIFGQRQTAGGAAQQFGCGLFFKTPDLMAYGRLADVHPLCGSGEAAGFFDGNKGAQQRRVEIHLAHS